MTYKSEFVCDHAEHNSGMMTMRGPHSSCGGCERDENRQILDRRTALALTLMCDLS